MENKPAKPRYEYVDLMKGVCIILVVIQHLVGQCAVNPPWLTTFRMPLYFMLSGLFFSTYGSLRTFLIKKFNSLLVPFFFTWILCWIHIRLHYEHPENFEILRYNVAIWFLIALFEVGLLFYFIYQLPKEWMKALVSLLISIGGYMMHQWDIHLPLYLDAAMSATVFYYIGPLIRRFHLLEPHSRRTTLLCAAVSILVFGTLAYLYPTSLLDLRLNRIFTPYPVFLLSAVSGTAAVFFLCKLIRRIPLVSYWGRYSIITLCSHIFIYKLLNEYGALEALRQTFGIDAQLWAEWKLGPWIGVVSVFFLTLPLIWLLIRHIPFLCSQMPLLDPKSGKIYKSPRTLLRIFLKGKRADD